MTKPNILFIISDQHQKVVTGCYGNDLVRTPNIDALAADGMTFDQAYCQAPLCGPSRSSVMTGTFPHTCNAFGHGESFVLHDLPTLGSIFRDAGYVTGSFGKVHIRGEEKNGRDLGFDERYLRYLTYWWQDYIDEIGKENVDKYWCPHHKAGLALNPNNEPIELEEELIYDSLVGKRTVQFLEEHREEPFCLWVGLEKPHPEWYAPAEYHAMYNPDDMPIPETFAEPFGEGLPLIIRETNFNAKHYPQEDVRHMTAAYYANVSYMDDVLGRILSAVDRFGLRENTIVVYTSDHGEMLFDHGLVQKHCFFEAAVAVPLLIRAPGVTPAGSRCSVLAGLTDLIPTFCELTGTPAPAGLEGRSLAPFLAGQDETDPDHAVFSEFYSKGAPERMIRTRDWKYIYTHSDLPQLYSVADDPLEQHNVAALPEFAQVRNELEKRLMDGWEFDPEIHREGRRER